MGSDSARKVSHRARKVSHGDRKVSHGAKKVSYGARKVSHGAWKMAHGARQVFTVYCLLSRQLQNVQPVSDCEDSCRQSIQLQAV